MDFSDILGNKAREENAVLRKDLSAQTKKCEQQAKELDAIKAHVAAFNIANSSIEFYKKTREENDQKAAVLIKQVEELDIQSQNLNKQVAELNALKTALNTDITVSEKKFKVLHDELSRMASTKIETEEMLKELHRSLGELTDKVNQLTNNQYNLLNSNTWLEQIITRIDRHDDKSTCFIEMLHDLQRFVNDDKISAMQLNLASRPLLLVVDVGIKQTAIALVRGGSDFIFESKGHIKIGAVDFENALANWLKIQFLSSYKTLKNVPVECFKPSAQRLFMLMCQGAPQGDVEETIIVDGQSLPVTYPLFTNELAPAFQPMLAPNGKYIQAIQKGLTTFKYNADELDQIICLGMFGRFPLLRESLSNVFKRTVLVLEGPHTIMLTKTPAELMTNKSIDQSDDKISIEIIKSDLKQVNNKRIINLDSESLVFRDKSTGLMWVRNGNIYERKMNWHQASNIVDNYNYAGYCDWRLPTIDEIEQLAEQAGIIPHAWFNSHGFNNVKADGYWSGNLGTSNASYAWCVNMANGKKNNCYKTADFYVWPVRGTR